MNSPILSKNINKKNIFIVLICLAALAGLLAAIVVTHYDKANAYKAMRDEQAAAADLESRNREAAAAAKEAQRNADMTKLVSICIDAQESYDALTAKQKIGKVRPDCTVSE